MHKTTNSKQRVEIATTTLCRLEEGSYECNSSTYDLAPNINFLKDHTTYYPPDSTLSNWATSPNSTVDSDQAVQISTLEISTIQGARYLAKILSKKDKRIGVLNFASAKNPGGGFLRGSQAQEESLARSSTLYASLMTSEGQKFYKLHKADPKFGYYSHAMIYSPRVVLLRQDNGDWDEPLEVDILVSAAVNAGVVRRELAKSGSNDESELNAAMKERMARILFLFETQGVRNLVLGSFGTGVFRNNVDVVVDSWAELLVGNGARFAYSFDHVVFAVIDHPTFEVFRKTFGQ